jgi:hypothetical protein
MFMRIINCKKIWRAVYFFKLAVFLGFLLCAISFEYSNSLQLDLRPRFTGRLNKGCARVALQEIIHLRSIDPSMDKQAQVGLVGDDLSRQGNLGACGRDRWHAAVHAVVVGSIHASPIPVNAAAQRCTFAMLPAFSLYHTDLLIVISMHFPLAVSALCQNIRSTFRVAYFPAPTAYPPARSIVLCCHADDKLLANLFSALSERAAPA